MSGVRRRRQGWNQRPSCHPWALTRIGRSKHALRNEVSGADADETEQEQDQHHCREVGEYCFLVLDEENDRQAPGSSA